MDREIGLVAAGLAIVAVLGAALSLVSRWIEARIGIEPTANPIPTGSVIFGEAAVLAVAGLVVVGLLWAAVNAGRSGF